jgi:hypothetical protein
MDPQTRSGPVNLRVTVEKGNEILSWQRRALTWWGSRGVRATGRQPWLVVRNAAGEAWPLFEAANAEEAQDKRGRLEAELVYLGAEAWCDRYKVPVEFVSAGHD